ncbi:hypothetical protein N44_00487 [Microcystis aeruginosa NIES-44]|uniref:Uncharacterized protein n=1 Tax=Microcystis aeruginosa NIES-44 TaxID=449439 RepID=A0A0A1VRE5_MICAE|nr:hypothetical protein N44_00487 [Microcystis aeruginosa NIES-44]
MIANCLDYKAYIIDFCKQLRKRERKNMIFKPFPRSLFLS